MVRLTTNQNPLRSDPTRLTTLRRMFNAAGRNRLRLIRSEIRQLLVDQDALNIEWGHLPTDQKIDRFRERVGEITQRILLSRDWWSGPIQDAYRRGALSSLRMARQAGLSTSEDTESAQREFLRQLAESRPLTANAQLKRDLGSPVSNQERVTELVGRPLSSTRIELDWSGAADEWQIERNGLIVDSVMETRYREDADPGTESTYRVRGITDGREGLWSSRVTVRTPPRLLLPIAFLSATLLAVRFRRQIRSVAEESTRRATDAIEDGIRTFVRPVAPDASAAPVAPDARRRRRQPRQPPPDTAPTPRTVTPSPPPSRPPGPPAPPSPPGGGPPHTPPGGIPPGDRNRIAAGVMQALEREEQRMAVIVETEVTRDHGHGQIDGIDRLGIDEVSVEAEVRWQTMQDARVCPMCRPLQGKIFKVDEAIGLIPRHPRCRCSFILLRDPNSRTLRQALETRAAVRRSAFAETGVRGRRGQRRSRWPGTRKRYRGPDQDAT